MMGLLTVSENACPTNPHISSQSDCGCYQDGGEDSLVDGLTICYETQTDWDGITIEKEGVFGEGSGGGPNEFYFVGEG